MRKGEIIRIIIAGAAFAGVLSGLITQNIISTAQAIEPTILFVLVLVTIVYAKRTAEIAKETREQRYSESLPLVVPIIGTVIANEMLKHNEIDYELLKTGSGVRVTWRNIGKGAAINLRFSLWGLPLYSGKVPFFSPLASQTLESGGQVKISFDHQEPQRLDKPEGYRPRLEAKYQDVYERRITTVREFHIIEEQDNTKRAFLGDLYFTVNGKRLGRETTPGD
jgi:hypothetical protein